MSDHLTQQQCHTLIELLAEDDAVSRASAARALGEARAGLAVSALLPLLHDADEEVRAAAAEALGLLRAGRAVEQLQELREEKSRTLSSRGGTGIAAHRNHAGIYLPILAASRTSDA